MEIAASTPVEHFVLDDPGMVRNLAHKYGINSITLETGRNKTPVMDTANSELKMIKAWTKYLGFP